MRFADRYKIIRELGRGGMGVSYLVTDLANTKACPEKYFALKTLLPDKISSEQIQQFTHEAEQLRQVQHPNLARLLASGQWRGQPYYLSEYIEGKDILTACRGRDWNVIFSLLVQGCWGLQAMHSIPLVHRDLKPENILVGKIHASPDTHESTHKSNRWALKIIDFGLAQHQLKNSGSEIVGTLPYIAPEILTGSPYDHRADLYVWGIILYQIAFQQLPHASEQVFSKYFAKLKKQEIDFSPLESAQKIPPGILIILKSLLKHDPDDRLQSATEIIRILNQNEDENFPLQWDIALSNPNAKPLAPINIHPSKDKHIPSKSDNLDEALGKLLSLIRSGARKQAWDYGLRQKTQFSQVTDAKRTQKYLGAMVYLLIEQGNLNEAQTWLQDWQQDPQLAPTLSLEHAILSLQWAQRSGNKPHAKTILKTTSPTQISQAPLDQQTRWFNYVALDEQEQKHYLAAAKNFEHAAELAQQSGRQDHSSSLLLNAANLYCDQSQWKQAYRLYLKVGPLIAAQGHVAQQASYHSNLGNLLLFFGKLSEAETNLQKSLQLALQENMFPLAAYNIYLLTLGEEMRGNWERVHRYLKQAQDLKKELTGTPAALQILLAEAYFKLAQQDYTGCAQLIAKLGPAAKAIQSEEYEIQINWLAAKLQLANQKLNAPQVKRWLQAAQHNAKSKGLKNSLWQIESDLGELALQQQKPQQAQQHFAKALSKIQDLQSEVPANYQYSFERDRKKEKLRKRLAQLSEKPIPAESKKQSPNFAPQNLPTPIKRETKMQTFPSFEQWTEINRRILTQYNTDTLLEEILDIALELTNAERGFVILSETQSLEIRAARNMDHESLDREEERFSRTMAKEVLRTGRSQVWSNPKQDPNYGQVHSVHELQIHSALCIPIKLGPRPMGLVYLDNRFQQESFTADTLPWLEALADQTSLALEHARLHAQAQEHIDDLEKDLESTHWDLAAAKETLRRHNADLGLKYRYEQIIGKSPALAKVLKLVDQVTDSMVNVFIHGASGTGKELIAQALHFNSPRKTEAFISENCAALSAGLLESELFGHVKGAFTGADKDKLGLFHLADRGTLFLDEIGEMPLNLQAKLLRVLQEGEVRQVGGKEYKKVNIRVVSASNRNLKQMVAKGKFRQDLFFRLNVLQIDLPGLKDRPEDIPLLAQHFLRQFAAEENRPAPALTKEATKRLLDYHWPGNIRELQNEIKRCVVLGFTKIGPKQLSAHLLGPSGDNDLELGPKGMNGVLQEVERQVIHKTLKKYRWNKLQAAKALKMGRCTLYEKIEKYSLKRASLDKPALKS